MSEIGNDEEEFKKRFDLKPVDTETWKCDAYLSEIDGAQPLPIYVSKTGTKPIVVTHELPGMTTKFLRYCNLMADRGFKVYAPLMFGKLGESRNNVQMISFCINAEFKNLYKRNRTDSQEESRFSTWLLHLASDVSRQHQDQNVGVIGMCLTGGFVLVAFAEPAVNSVVCCQPAYPFRLPYGSLGMTDRERSDIQQAADKLGAGCAKGFRHRFDVLSLPCHVRAIKNLMNHDNVERYVHKTLPGFGHSVVTGKKRNEEVEDEITRFLNARLT